MMIVLVTPYCIRLPGFVNRTSVSQSPVRRNLKDRVGGIVISSFVNSSNEGLMSMLVSRRAEELAEVV